MSLDVYIVRIIIFCVGKVIDMGYMNPEQLRANLRTILNDEKVVTQEKFNDIVLAGAEIDVSSPDLFNLLDTHGRGYLTEDDINTMSHDLLKQFARAIDPPHGEYEDEEEETEDDSMNVTGHDDHDEL